ncbi:relaxase/mobilization nuclease domain-containing protein [Rivularia sp. UHCC 0363]|uniref:relaxase/mobilization nuclease domain-containing protein n=1 Tax=Rivularia sp. UHCC 0363 TaxID=3110244 RepID=UPI002B219E13|nr:relaxase/mobilization nuclease domain-containing protein [Rivularia sp. UHCC 0363]MEA5599260.1 relaxase/mobilization nuclease domain-containing protein [Rivularia sp. UHCC 0363]
MIGNITKGNGFYGCVAYVLGKENAQLINSNMASTTPTGLAWEFRKFAQLNQRVEKPVLHLSLSPAPGDRILDEWELCMIAQDLLEGLELSNNQFILVQHNDAEYEGEIRPHVHLVINRVSHDGKCNDDYLDYYRTEKLLRQIEKDYDLIPQPSSWEVEKKKAYPKHAEKAAGGLNIVERLQNAIAKRCCKQIERAAVDKPEMPVFVARLLKDNIQVNCKFTRTGKLKGISYCMDGEAFKGGDLGKLYTHIGIREHLGVGYQQHYSDAIRSLIEQPTIETPAIPTSDDICPEIIANNNNNSDSTNESITDSTSVVEPARPGYKSVVPSLAEIFPTTFNGFEREESKNVIQAATPVESQPTTTPEPQTVEPTAKQTGWMQQIAQTIADTVRLLGEQQKLSQKIRNANGKIYDLQLADSDVIKVMRKSGEIIAEIPLDADKEPSFLALTSVDIENWSSIQNAQFKIEARLALQQEPATKRNGEEDEELG